MSRTEDYPMAGVTSEIFASTQKTPAPKRCKLGWGFFYLAEFLWNVAFFLSRLCRIFFVTDSRRSTWLGLGVSQCRVLGIGAKERILVECGNNTHFWCKRRTPLVPPFPDPSYYCWTMPPTKVFLQRNCPLSNFGGELEKYLPIKYWNIFKAPAVNVVFVKTKCAGEISLRYVSTQKEIQ